MRRVHVPILRPGELPLTRDQAHHARDVLRLRQGDAVEAFDDAGRTARATLASCTEREVILHIEQVHEPAESAFRWTVASAVPKGGRVDWMIEKLSELGAAAFVPLAAARSVVLPEGKGKRERWARLAAESAKQSRRVGVMRIEELTPVADFLRQLPASKGWYLSTAPGARTVPEILADWTEPASCPTSLVLLVGPEGGWIDEELASFHAAGLTAVSLGSTVLRVETAAVAAGAIMAAVVAPLATTTRARS